MARKKRTNSKRQQFQRLNLASRATESPIDLHNFLLSLTEDELKTARQFSQGNPNIIPLIDVHLAARQGDENAQNVLEQFSAQNEKPT